MELPGADKSAVGTMNWPLRVFVPVHGVRVISLQVINLAYGSCRYIITLEGVLGERLSPTVRGRRVDRVPRPGTRLRRG